MLARAGRNLRDRIAIVIAAIVALVATSGCENRKVIKARPAPTPPVVVVTDPLGASFNGSTTPAEPAADATCGAPGLPECPLQYWMDHHLSGPLSAEDFPTLAQSFHTLSALEPPGFSGWGLWAQGGAAAAERDDEAGVRRACAGCHDTYRNRYRKTMRDRPLKSNASE